MFGRLAYCLLAILFIVGIVSCEKVINVDIQQAPFRYVVEGVVSDKSDSAYVIVSKTTAVFDTKIFDGLNNAHVSISKDGGASVLFRYVGDGKYKGKMTGTPGSTYKLQVSIDNEFFTATSTMPQKVSFDSLYTSHRLFLGKDAYIPVVQYQDPAGIKNAYRFKVWVRGFESNTIYLADDKLTDGRLVRQELYNFNTSDTTLQKYDWLIVEMMCIDEPVFNFWNTLNQSSSGQSQTSSPGNPVNNITGGALGYFSAETYEKIETSAE